MNGQSLDPRNPDDRRAVQERTRQVRDHVKAALASRNMIALWAALDEYNKLNDDMKQTDK